MTTATTSDQLISIDTDKKNNYIKINSFLFNGQLMWWTAFLLNGSALSCFNIKGLYTTELNSVLRVNYTGN